MEAQLRLPISEPAAREARLDQDATRLAVDRAHQLDHAARLDRAQTRTALEWLLDELQLHVELHYRAALAPLERQGLRTGIIVHDLVDLLLELRALDLCGIAELVASGDNGRIRRLRAARRRRHAAAYSAMWQTRVAPPATDGKR